MYYVISISICATLSFCRSYAAVCNQYATQGLEVQLAARSAPVSKVMGSNPAFSTKHKHTCREPVPGGWEAEPRSSGLGQCASSLGLWGLGWVGANIAGIQRALVESAVTGVQLVGLRETDRV